jgi:hypothetical protein
VRVLERGRWKESARSKLLPALDVQWLSWFVAVHPQSKAVRTLANALRLRKRRR